MVIDIMSITYGAILIIIQPLLYANIFKYNKCGLYYVISAIAFIIALCAYSIAIDVNGTVLLTNSSNYITWRNTTIMYWTSICSFLFLNLSFR